MKQKLRALILLVVFTLSVTVQTVSAATYSANSAEEGIIQFNKAMVLNDTDVKLEYNKDEADITQDLYELKYSPQDYANSDYGYYSMKYISISSSDQMVDGVEKNVVEYSIDRLETQEQTQYVYDTIHQLIRNDPTILKASDYDKAAWAYDYIINHVTYDHNLQIYTAYGALHDGTAVCQGYSLLFYAFATELGLNCKIVSGTAYTNTSSGPHAWNVLELDGKWYIVDTTWGASRKERKYFLALNKDMSDHILSSDYENCFDFATENYMNQGYSQNHGVLASVYNVVFDPLKKYTMSSDEDFQWLINNPDNIALTFTSDNKEIATVSDTGVITGVGLGTTEIRAKNETLGIEQVCEVTVNKLKPKVTAFRDITLKYKKSADIYLQIYPVDAKLENVTYTSKDNQIASVDANGKVTGLRAGSTKIVVAYGNKHQVEIPVTVQPFINRNYSNITVSIRKTKSIKNAVTVSNDGYRDLSFKTSNAKIAKVSGQGTVTGVKKGKCSIKIYDKDTKKLAATVKVTVK